MLATKTGAPVPRNDRLTHISNLFFDKNADLFIFLTKTIFLVFRSQCIVETIIIFSRLKKALEHTLQTFEFIFPNPNNDDNFPIKKDNFPRI